MNEPLERKTALVIEDDLVVSMMVLDHLSELGISCCGAENGADGLSEFMRHRPDIVLLDVGLPDVDGFAICEQIRSLPYGAHTIVLMVTGSDDVESVERAYRAGATDFVSKPLNFTLLMHRVRYLLRTKHTSDLLRESEKKLARVQSIARIGGWEFDFESGAIALTEQAKLLFTGAAHLHLFNAAHIFEQIDPRDRCELKKRWRHHLKRGKSFDVDYALTRLDGQEVYIHQETEFLLRDDGYAKKAIGTIQDVTELHEATSKIRQLAYFDSVTGLANRSSYSQHLKRELENNPSKLGVVFIDLDQFKRINDTLGHPAGDALLMKVSERLQLALKQSRLGKVRLEHHTLLARFGGDEFALMFSYINDKRQLRRYAENFLALLKEPFLIEEKEVYVSASMGISVFPEDGRDAATLLKRADIAMYQVKAQGRNHYRFYNENMDVHMATQLNTEAHLWSALRKQEFVLHYQPKISVQDNHVVGMEALIRWQRNGDLVPPNDFIPVAEASCIIVPIGDWVLNTACQQVANWNRQLHKRWQISVNVSAAQLRQEDFAESVKVCLKRSGLAPELLELELTETAMMECFEASLEALNELRQLGVRVALDDFGTGYSSLNYLKRLPIDCIKIDRSFVREIDSDDRDAAIVESTISLAHRLQMGVTAEGVEDLSHLRVLKKLHCDTVQGFLYSAAKPEKDFVQWASMHERISRPGRKASG